MAQGEEAEEEEEGRGPGAQTAFDLWRAQDEERLLRLIAQRREELSRLSHARCVLQRQGLSSSLTP
jgi:hypothetical protein